MSIPRSEEPYLTTLITESVAPHRVILLKGARQVGKTTLMERVLATFNDTLSFNLEEDKILRSQIDQTTSFCEFEELLRLHRFDRSKEQLLFIDEVQESRKIGSYVRFMKEKWPHTRSILSGSSMFTLFEKEVRLPVGRVTPVSLLPYQFEEFLRAGGEDLLIEKLLHLDLEHPLSALIHERMLSCVDSFIAVGGLPEVVADFYRKRDYRRTRRSILLVQEEDFYRKEPSIKPNLFQSALRGVANHLGSTSKYSHVDDSTPHAKAILNLMNHWELIFDVEQKGMNSSSSFFPKRYLYDIGMAQDIRIMPFPPLSLLQTSDPALRTQLGGIFENLVYLTLRSHELGSIPISAWKKSSKDDIEVDFILHDTQPIPIECKASLKVSQRSFVNLRHYLNASGLPLGILVSAAPLSVHREEGKTFINLPIYACSVRGVRRILRGV